MNIVGACIIHHFVGFVMNNMMETFGGEKAVMEKLADLGLLSKTIRTRQIVVSWCFEKDRKFPPCFAQVQG